MKTAVLTTLGCLVLVTISDVADSKPFLHKTDKTTREMTYAEETTQLILAAYKTITLFCDVIQKNTQPQPCPERAAAAPPPPAAAAAAPPPPEAAAAAPPPPEAAAAAPPPPPPPPPQQKSRQPHHPGENSPVVVALLTGQEAELPQLQLQLQQPASKSKQSIV